MKNFLNLIRKQREKLRALIDKKFPIFNNKTRKKINHLCCFAESKKPPKPS